MTIPLFRPNCLPALIGSLPMDNHQDAQKLVMDHTPDIPLWVQLPKYKEEGMTAQFLPGMPGFFQSEDSVVVDTKSADFDQDLLAFYEEYMSVTENAVDLESSRFVLTADTAKGFFTLLDTLTNIAKPPIAVKGQITGPITFGVGVHNVEGQAIFYDTQARDVAVKLIALKARWQARKLKSFGAPVMIFFDEPALTGFGSSAFISITREDVLTCFEEVISAVHQEGALTGIHVCANADWSLVLESGTNVVSFDAYAYFDKFILYPELIQKFMAKGNILAWGIVPTLNPEDIEKESPDSLYINWLEKAKQLEAIGIKKDVVAAQSMITPSCGTGSLSLNHAKKVLSLTQSLSQLIRERY
jgi:methionine synthase II (cobalamin-independent)